MYDLVTELNLHHGIKKTTLMKHSKPNKAFLKIEGERMHNKEYVSEASRKFREMTK